ncbi:hypothetical protein D3C72_1179260 [compost metagenome]
MLAASSVASVNITIYLVTLLLPYSNPFAAEAVKILFIPSSRLYPLPFCVIELIYVCKVVKLAYELKDTFAVETAAPVV